jgi:transposase-like protein
MNISNRNRNILPQQLTDQEYQHFQAPPKPGISRRNRDFDKELINKFRACFPENRRTTDQSRTLASMRAIFKHETTQAQKFENRNPLTRAIHKSYKKMTRAAAMAAQNRAADNSRENLLLWMSLDRV